MAIFLIFFLIVLTAIFRKKPSKKPRLSKPSKNQFVAKPVRSTVQLAQSAAAARNQKPVGFPDVKKSLPAQTKPNDMSIELAKKHFGWEWQEFLLTKPTKIDLNHNQIITIAGWAYQKLDNIELQDLLNSFIKIEINNNVTVRRPFVCTELHRAAYELMIAGRFESVPFKLALKKIIAAYRMESLGNNIAEHDTTTVLEKSVEPTIIDVDTINYQINYPNELEKIPTNVYADYNPDDYKLGKLYKDILNLSSQEAAWLNKFLFYGNTFNSNDGCKIALIRLYLQVIKKTVRRFANEPITLTKHLDAIKDAAYETSLKENRGWYGYNHNQAKSDAESDLYYTVFKKCEASLRVAWRVGRSSAPVFHSRSEKAITLFKQNIEPVLDEVIREYIVLVPFPDEHIVKLLNSQSTTRWKVDLELIMNQTNELTIKQLTEKIYHLCHLNVDNPAIENIYYEAVKIFAQLDKTESLLFYLHYIDADQRSARIDNKDFQKTTLKQLFSTEAQEQEFRDIVNELINSKNLKIALEKINAFYQPKRKRIILDNSAIERVAVQLNDTVEVLNQYLVEEEDVITHATPVIAEKIYTKLVILNPAQQELLDKFDAAGLQLSSTFVADFAKTKGLFKNQLIDSINDSCFETIDDVLIEQEDENYIILPDYFKQLFN